MKMVIERSEIQDACISETYEEPFPIFVPCKKCENKKAIIYMIINDVDNELVGQRPVDARIWPHDSSTVAIYLCTGCGSMRARWNQG